MYRVLVVDDDRSIRRTLEKLLTAEGLAVATAADGREALHKIEQERPQLVLLDLGLPGLDGLEVLARVQPLDEPRPAVIVVTARDDMASTVRAMQLGAYDYLVKPLDLDQLIALVRSATGLRAESGPLRSIAASAQAVGSLVGRSPAMRDVYKTIGALSTNRASVLVRGPSGTGKELVARAIHDCGPDASGPFVAVNCSALAHNLLESELFGHVRGAFTGAVADKPGRFELAGTGTIFLDEIAEIPLALQAKLLRVLQERSFERVGDGRPLPLRARIISATHQDLEQMVRTGAFREDLLYRLKVVEVRLAPLRERKEDIAPLVEHLLVKLGRELNKSIAFVSQDAMAALEAHSWPGNVRELENVLTRAVVHAKGNVLKRSLLPQETPTHEERPPEPPTAPEALSLRSVERQHIQRVLTMTGWNKRRACDLLEISRPTLDRKIEEYALRRSSEA